MRIQHIIALVVLSLLAVPGARAAVMAGPLTNAATRNAYYLLSEADWATSEAEARGLGGHLVTINDAAENLWVVNTFFPLIGDSQARIWIGLNDAANEGQFVWASGEPVAFTYWSPGEPNNSDNVLGNADHVGIRYASFPPVGRWMDYSEGVIDPTSKTFGVVEVPLPPPPFPVPVAVTHPADQITAGGSSARLNGLANPSGVPTVAWFEWGTSAAYGNVTPPQSVGTGSNAMGFTNVLVGLISGTEYHFRARASNAFGMAYGLDRAFKMAERPTVLVGPITNDANGHHYYLLSANSWTVSEAEARRLGGHLVTMNDFEENHWVPNTFIPLIPTAYPSLWIGLNDVANAGQFVWASREPVTFTNWYPGEPNDQGGEHYVSLRHPAFSPPASWEVLPDTPASPIFGIVEVPVPLTQPADQFTPSSARLNGQANPDGVPTMAWFEWGPSLDYGNSTPPVFIGSGNNIVGFSNVIVGLVSGTDYHFRARTSHSTGFGVGLDRTFNLNAQRPVVTTLASDQLTLTSARLSGQVNPLGWPTTAWFEWGTDTNYGNVIGLQDVGQGSIVSNISVVLDGPMFGPNFHYRLVASNAFGLAAGLDRTLNLNALRPVVTTLAADQLSLTSARLKGQVNPRGWPTAAWFEWGTNASYGNVIGLQEVGQSSNVLNVAAVLDGLMAGPDYHYRLVATNAFGLEYGANQTFNLGVVPTDIKWTGADPSGYWSAPANWFPNGAPTNGSKLVFPGGLPSGEMVSTNDLAGGIFRSIRFEAGGHTIRGNPITLTNRSDVIVNSGTNVIACDLTFTGTPATPDYQFPSIRPSGFPAELTVIGNVSGGSLYSTIWQLVIRGQFTGGSIRVTYGNLALLGDNPHPVAVEILGTPSSTLRVQGSQPNLDVTMLAEMEIPSCPTLTGDGVVGNVTGCGQIDLGSELSVKNLRLPNAPFSRGTMDIRLNGTNVGEYGRLISSGDVSLSRGRLLPSAGFVTQAGQVFTIIEKTSPGPLPNAPFGPEGTVTNLNGRPFRLSYVGGDGNDVTLTAEAINMGFVPIPIPGLPGVSFGSVAWGDYDNDGRLDFLLTGYAGSPASQLWRNTGSGFSNVTASVAPGLPGVQNSSAAWGDYDNDGRLDFLLAGCCIGAQVWRNTGSGFSNVTASVAPGLPGVYGGSVAWGDYDNDGRLDCLLTGLVGGSPVSQLWRNTGSGFSNVTAGVAPGLPKVYGGSAAWGDYDNDGRLDFLLAGSGISQVWRNTGSGFSNVTASVAPGLLGVFNGSVAWGDYDNDGRLDFLLASTFYGSQLWRNTGSGFSNVTVSVAPGLPARSSVAWGDYDNDGRLDFLITGTSNSVTPQLWRNTGGGFSNVTASVVTGLPASFNSSVAWGDYDNDGRLDFLHTGYGASQLWWNNMPVSNTPPAAPSGLSSTLSGDTVSLNWNSPADDRTPSPGLNYNLRIGTTPGASDVLAPMALTDGLRLLPALGNAQSGTNAFMFNLTPGRDYYWSVQAVDTSFAGSPFAAEQQFTVAAPRIIDLLMLGNGHFQFSFTNQSSAVYEILGTTNVSLPVAQWSVLGLPTHLGGGLYRFTDVLTPNHAQRFYLLRAQ